MDADILRIFDAIRDERNFLRCESVFDGGIPCMATDGDEAVEFLEEEFDPEIIPYEKLLEIFWHTHNPTTLNRQGNDVGTQYRSVIFYHDDIQKEIAEKSKAEIEEEHLYPDPVVTEIVPFEKFYEAESYHKDYYDRNSSAPYCNFVIDAKIRKLLSEYKSDVKDEYQEKQQRREARRTGTGSAVLE
jgi:methionine-S-sulfoxide reductase